MNQLKTNNSGLPENKRAGVRPMVRSLALGFAFFAAGLALCAAWFLRAPSVTPVAPAGEGQPALSEATRTVLQRLASPVEIHFYSILDPGSAVDSSREFSSRVDHLLAQYEQAAGGKIKVTRINSISTGAANAAVVDGIKAFNTDKGEACYLGLTVARGDQKETLAALTPEWADALESDLSRAIARAYERGTPVVVAPVSDAVTVDAVKQLIPNIDSVSVEDGQRLLHLYSYAAFQQAVQDMQAKVAEAEQHFLQAQANQSEDGQAAARNELQQIQADHLTKLRQLNTIAQAQVGALQQLKGATH